MNAAERFQAALHARMLRPSLLSPLAFELVRQGGAFRASMGEGEGSASERPYERRGDVAVVTIRGALAQRAWSCWDFSGDGYDAIERRVREALGDSAVRSVVLAIDSPGGEVAGCFQCVRALREASKAAGKPLIAYVDEMACSAAYALACACETIVAPDTALLGSIGVIAGIVDESAALDQIGVKVHLITSGARKADGHPEIPFTDDARAAIQAEIDALAQVFFAEVAEARGMTTAAVQALEAGVFVGHAAVEQRLADAIDNFDGALARAGISRPTGAGARRMKTVLEALGLSAEASEADALLALSKIQTQQARLVELAAAADPGEAEGVFRAWGKSHERVGELEAAEAARVEAERKRAEAAEKLEREQLINAAFDGGRLSAADRDDPDSFVHGMTTAGLRKFASTAKQILPVGKKHEEADSQEARDFVALTQKPWAELSAREKHNLKTNHPDVAERLERAAST